jgi:cysteine desulfurase
VIYLDYNATAPLLPEALEAMLPYLREHYGNASSIHAVGREARAAIDSTRDRIAALLHAKPNEIIFTGGGTESDNLAVIGLARAHAARGKHLITSVIEHHAVMHAFDFLEHKEGFRVTRLPVSSAGRIDLAELESALHPDTILVSIMSANNETGVRQPVREAASLCRTRGVLFHTDAVQSFAKEPLDARDFDALSLAAHKFGGPKGAGVLYLRSGLPLERLQLGGSHENERRAGTEDVAAIAGLAAAAACALASMPVEQPRQRALREQLWAGVQQAYPEALRNGAPDDTVANTLNVCFPNLDGESLLMNLDLSGICASSGSACMVGSVQPSHVLLAMGRAPELARAAVRFSLGRGTTEQDIRETSEHLTKIVHRLRAA